jgi:hypothetical protein
MRGRGVQDDRRFQSAGSGDWLADLVEIGEQARVIMRRHPWASTLVVTRATIGPRGADVLERVLDVLDGHPASSTAKCAALVPGSKESAPNVRDIEEEHPTR